MTILFAVVLTTVAITVVGTSERLCRLCRGNWDIRPFYPSRPEPPPALANWRNVKLCTRLSRSPSSELLAGSYTSRFSRTYTRTNFTIAANKWYDLIISWTPSVIKFYEQTPILSATNTTNISKEPQYLLVGNCRYRNGSLSVNLLVDKVEWLYKTAKGGSFRQENLLKF